MKTSTIWIISGAAAAVILVGGTAVALSATNGFGSDEQARPVATATADVTDPPTSTAPAAGRDDDDRRDSDDRNDQAGVPQADAEMEAAIAAAFAHLGQSGTVIELERDDDPEEMWEIEIRLDDGREVDVELDVQLRIVDVDFD